MEVVYKKPKMLTDTPLHYCPGCTHGIVHKLIAQVLEELGKVDGAIGVVPVGCAVFGYKYFKCDVFEAAHGRAPATASAIRRVVNPDNIVFTYQGDGDLASIGMAETVHACMRGENITIIFINNGIYGMTGGQMAPTTMPGEKATTCIYGRDPKVNGNPVHMCEMLATLTGPAYIERVSCYDAAHVNKTKAALKKAFQIQMEKKGLSFIEIVANCPSNYHQTPLESMQFVKEKGCSFYPLGVFKDITKEEK
ncbi:thiamine pyrophosphate TPP-binding domain-containing protein [Firmicutes bacterium CAG:552]|nr:MAG: MFS transporter [Firmicutes bacterium CAG:552_39_19]CDB25368.1 thiamine pyrophosphate TPP-binding domain-containing protein [Firmicutes bacterium CAG:552]